MGAGRKTETYTLPPKQDMQPYTVEARNLMKKHLGAVIFGCKNFTMKECLSKNLFGLPAPHYLYVKNIEPGLPLFLFNCSERKLYGIFEATSHGQMNIDPNGWTNDGLGKTQFPAQVQMRVRLQCPPLLESQFKPIIADNYVRPGHFNFELDHLQTRNLISLLESLANSPGKPVQQYRVQMQSDVRALPSSSMVQKAETCQPPTSEADHLKSSTMELDSTTSLTTMNWESDFPALPSRQTVWKKAESCQPPTSEADHLKNSTLELDSSTSVTTVNWESDFSALLSRQTVMKNAESCQPPISEADHLKSSCLKFEELPLAETAVPHNRMELETAFPAVPLRSATEKPEWPYQHNIRSEHPNSLRQYSSSCTPQNTLRSEADFPYFPSLSALQEPEWLEALISEDEQLNSLRMNLDSAPPLGTNHFFQAPSAEQEEIQLIYSKLKNLQHNLHSGCQNMPLSGGVIDSEEKRAESPQSFISDQKSGDNSCYFSVKSSDTMIYPWIIAKLVEEVQELKAIRMEDTKKMSYLEEKLMRAELEIQQLTDLIVDGL